MFGWLKKMKQAPAGKPSIEEQIDTLHRDATQYKEEKNLEKAIECLKEAEILKENTQISYPIKHSLRLPLFLQQAGQFDEAMNEFQRLIDNTENRVMAWLPKRNLSSKKMCIHADLMQIYAAMETACKREKKFDLVEKYKLLHEKHQQAHATLLKDNMRQR